MAHLAWLAVAGLLLASSAPARTVVRPYTTVDPADFAGSHHTHVCATGQVTLSKREADGDWHFRVTSSRGFIVAEIIPAMPQPPPKVGDLVTVCGIRRYDDKHNWWEIHPVERWH